MADGSEIAIAYFALVPSARGIGSAIEAEIVGPASAAGQKAGNAAGTSLASTMTKVLAGAAVFTFLKGAFDQVQAMQKVTGQTNAALTSSKDASGQSAQGIASIATELSKVDAINHNVIQSGENVALTFTNIKAPIFKRSTADALDFAVATGRAIPAAAQLLDRALQDPVQGMARLRLAGVVLTAQQKDQIKTFESSGQMMAAQGVILDAFEAKYKGSAAAQATASDHAKVAIQGLEEAVGKDLLPVLSTSANVVAKAAGAFSALPTSVQQVSGALLVGSVAWGKYGDKIEKALDSASKVTLTGGQPKALANVGVDVARVGVDSSSARLATANDELSVSLTRATEATRALQIAEETSEPGSLALTYARTEEALATKALAGAEAEQSAAAKANAVATADLAAAQAGAAETSGGLLAAIGELNPLIAAGAAAWVLYSYGHKNASDAGTAFRESVALQTTDLGKLKATLASVAEAQSNLGHDKAKIGDFGGSHQMDAYAADLAIIKNGKSDALDLATSLLAVSSAEQIAAEKASFLGAGIKNWQLVAAIANGTLSQLDQILAGAPTPANAAFAAWKKAATGQVALAQSTNTLTGGFAALKDAEAEAAGTGADEWAQKLANITTYTSDTKAVAQAQQTLAGSEYSYTEAVQSTANAEYSRVQAVKAVSEAIYSEQQAEYTLTQARQTEATDLTKITTLTQSLTQARLDATRALVNDQLSAKGDQLSVSAARYALDAARRAEQAGVTPANAADPNAQAELRLAERQAALALSEAQEKATESAQDLHHEQQLGVNKAPGVVSATQALADGYKTVSDDAHTVADDSHAVASAQDGVVSAMHGVSTANQGVMSAYHQQSVAAQQVRTDTDDLATAEAKRVSDQQQNIVILAGLQAKGASDSKDLRLAMIGDLLATEAELDKLHIKGQDAYKFLDSALIAAGVSQAVIDSAFGYSADTALPATSANKGRSFTDPKTFAPAALVNPTNPLADTTTTAPGGNVNFTQNVHAVVEDPRELERRTQRAVGAALAVRPS